MSERIALIDLDGTLADYDGAMQRDMALIRSPYEPNEFIPHISEEPYIKERKKMIRSQPNWWLNLEPLKAGFDILEELKKLNFELHVLTKAPHNVTTAWTEKVLWCQKYLPGIDVTITPKKGMVYGKILVDDWPPYVMAWLKYRPRGLAIMPKQQWNIDCEHPNLIRYDGSNMEQVVSRLSLLDNS